MMIAPPRQLRSLPDARIAPSALPQDAAVGAENCRRRLGGHGESSRRLRCGVMILMTLVAMGIAREVPARDKPHYEDISAVFPQVTNAPSASATNPSPVAGVAAVHSAPTNAAPAGGAATNIFVMATTNSMDTLDDKYILAIGDRLSFRIIEDEDDPKPLFVTDSGELEVPYIGRFPAVGKTCKALAFELKAALEKEYYYQATVIIAVDLKAKSRGKVYLVGPVRAPGPQEIPSDEVLTVSKAILRAGGFNDYADRHHVKVTRKSGASGADQTFTVDVAEILEKGKSAEDLPLQPGDLIYIPERLIRF